MLRHYLLVAYRNLTRNKAFSAINILGLALGLTCSLFIGLWVHDERSVDQFNIHSDRLYAIYQRQHTGGIIKPQYNQPGILADELKRVLPEVQYASGVTPDEVNTFEGNNKILKEDGIYAGKDFFTMFTYPLLEGDKATVLSESPNIAISRKMATDLFGSPHAAIGQPMLLNNGSTMKITGVFENVPENASSQFDYVINWEFFLKGHKNMQSYNNTGVHCYVMLREGADPAKFGKEIVHFLDKYAHHEKGYWVELETQRWDEMYLHNRFNDEAQLEGGRIEYVRLFSIVAVFILLIACINFMNITTARSAKRAKEIGVRKVVGAMRMALIRQFIGEAMLLAFISMFVALLLLALLLPAFNMLTEKHIAFPSGVAFWTGILGVALVTGCIAGSYPALFLSSFRPVSVLKGTAGIQGIQRFRTRRSVSKQLRRSSLKLGRGNLLFRKGLVVFQFVVSIVLIVGTIVVSRQVNYIRTKDIGYAKENLLYIPLEGDLNGKYNLFKQEMLRLPGVKSVSHIGDPPTNITSSTWGIDWEGKDPNSKPTFGDEEVAYDFAKTMDIQVLQGHDFRKDMATDSIGYILNEEAVRIVGYKDPIGKPFTMWGRKATIIGVVKDFNFNSLHIPIRPFILYLGDNPWGGTTLVRTEPGKTRQVLDGVAALWKRMNPQFPFTYQFSDEEYDKLYKSELMAARLSNWFAGLAIVISCLGLLGLAMFTAEQRTKEIGIRKVLGASVGSVFRLLSGEFLLLVFLSLVIATPLAWLAMSKWLQDYAYHTNISWWMFVLAGVAALVITFLTIGFQTVRAALNNPVTSLRSE
ncbi:MAG TPA: ABC transporter permease [Puia sp.]|nr:ABC transporter permease [Puia sp.]